MKSQEALEKIREKSLRLGVKDKSYTTTRYGLVHCYSGQAFVEDFLCLGIGVNGTAGYIYSEGFVAILKIDTKMRPTEWGMQRIRGCILKNNNLVDAAGRGSLSEMIDIILSDKGGLDESFFVRNND